MNTLKLFIMLAFIPTTFSVASDASISSSISGIWTNYRTNTSFEIIKRGRNIYLQELDRRYKRKQIIFIGLGRGLYEDCNGRTLIIDGYDRIIYRVNNYRREGSMVLRKQRRSRQFDNHHYNDRNYPSNTTGIYGSWYCPQHRFTIRVEQYDDGIRIKRDNRAWFYYTQGRNNRYFDDDGNYYQLGNRGLQYINRKSGDRNLQFVRRN